MALLPVEKSKVRVNLSEQVVLIYGKPKIGKSTFCSKIDDALFIATEAGLNYLEVAKVNCTSWESFLEICAELAQGEHKYKVIIIDTIDNLVDYCSEYVCKREKINHPADYDYGRGWSMVTRELKVKLSKLANLPYGLIMVGHSKTEEVSSRTAKYSKDTITVTGGNRAVILNMTDMILYVDYEVKDEKETRVIRTKPTRHYDAGDRSGKLKEVLPLDYNEVVKCFKEE